jgi:hypothetical protein
MTLKEVLHRRDDAIMKILDRLKGKKLYNNLWVELKFFWQDSKREIYYATPWKDAQGDDLPIFDREVIALTQPYPNDEHLRVVFAHRPNKYANVWNSDLGEEQVVEIEGYDKGGWNQPHVLYWLDAKLPYEKNKIIKEL